jgi:hypothetical protein
MRTSACAWLGSSFDEPQVHAWATYFLNASNHDADIRGTAISIGYHAYPTQRTFTPDPATFTGMFEYVDTFLDQTVLGVEALIDALAPGTPTLLDETGCDMDQV